MAVQQYHGRTGPEVVSAMELDIVAHACSELLEPLEHQRTSSEPWTAASTAIQPGRWSRNATAGLAQGQLIVVFLPVTLP